MSVSSRKVQKKGCVCMCNVERRNNEIPKFLFSAFRSELLDRAHTAEGPSARTFPHFLG